MARPTNTDARRAQIVLALQTVMAERGYDRATIAEIAREANLTPGLVHYHFRSKQEILVELVGSLGAFVARRATARTPGPKVSPRARLYALIDGWLGLDDTADRSAVACWVNLGGEALQQPEVGAAFTRALQDALASFEEAVRAVLTAEARPTRSARAIAAGLLAAVEGYLRLSVTAPDATPRGSAARVVHAMADGAIDAERRTTARAQRTRGEV